MYRYVLIIFLVIVVIYLGIFPAKKKMIKESKKENVLLITAIPPKPCQSSTGDFVNIQSIENKLQYSQIKHHSFHLTSVQVDPFLNGPWNKLAMVRYMLEKNLNYEWIFWIDADALIINMDYDIPFQDYSKYDFVIYGDEDLLYKKNNVLLGLNTGAFLIRNNQWGRHFIRRACELGRNGTEKMKLVLKDYQAHLRDQNAVAFLLCTEIALRKRVFFEKRNFHRYWEEAKTSKQWNPFIMHFAGCEFCEGIDETAKKECFPYWNKFVNKSTNRFSKGFI